MSHDSQAQYVIEMFERLPRLKNKHITYFSNNQRVEKSWPQFSQELDKTVLALRSLINSDSEKPGKIGLIGPTSYHWMLFDLACLKGGIVSVGIPEHLKVLQIDNIVREEAPDLLLIDRSMAAEMSGITHTNIRYFSDMESNFFETIPISEKIDKEVIPQPLEDFGIAYTSGTSQEPKRVKLRLASFAEPRQSLFQKLNEFINYLFSFWSNRDNKLIIFMPFSHVQQRTFVKIALMSNISMVLSNPARCILHIIQEKPNVMVSVPVVYDTIAARIRHKLKKLPRHKKQIHKLYKKWGINGLGMWHPFKKLMEFYLFSDIKKLYGGRGSYFVVGSAKANIQSIKTFFDVGVKILEAYGQSETGTVSMSSHKHFKVGSVGKPAVELKISEEGEILLKMDERRNHKENEAVLNINNEQYIHSGDIGYLDEDGFLYLKGRKDEVIVLHSGRKLYPSTYELRLKELAQAEHAVIFSDDLKTLRAILAIAGNEIAREKVRMAILTLNKELNDNLTIESYAVDLNKWSTENGFLTNTFKVRRNEILKKTGQFEFHSVFETAPV